MTDFIKDLTDLPFPKTDLRPVPSGEDPVRYGRAADWNTVCQALIDTRSYLLGDVTTRFEEVEASVGDVDTIADAVTALSARTLSTGFGVEGGGTLAADRTFKLKSADIGYVAAKDPSFGAVGNGIANDRVAVQSAINTAKTLRCAVFLGEGIFLVDRAPGKNHSLELQDAEQVELRGVKGKTWIKHTNNAASGVGSCQILRISNCRNVKVRDVGFDGSWGNPLTYVTYQSDLQDLASLADNTLYVASTSGYPTSGTFTLVTASGPQVLSYTGRSATSFTGVSPGTGRVQKYDQIALLDKRQKGTKIAASMDGLTLPRATIAVESTTGFPTTVATNGIVRVLTSNGYQDIQYNGKNGTELLNCTGGTGTLATNNSVEYVEGAGNQITPMQVDPKNHAIFVYGSDGNFETPNRDILIEDCLFTDIYGDFIWTGAYTYDLRVVRCVGITSARNGLTISSFAYGVKIHQCRFDNCFTSAIDSEPVDSPCGNVTIDDCDFSVWFNPWASIANICMSIQGGSVGRPAEWTFCKHWRVTKSRFRGTVLISNAKDVIFDGNEVTCDFASTAFGPIVVNMFDDKIRVTNNYVWSRAAGSTLTGQGLINIVRYQTAVHTAAQPGDIVVQGNTCDPRNGLDGIYIEATGGYTGYTGTAIGYVPSTGSAQAELSVAGTPWASLLDYFAGHQIVMDGKIANIVGNTANKLYVAPLYENYNGGKSWSDWLGRTTTDATLGTFTILPLGGWVRVVDNTIDCRNTDGCGAGRRGISIGTDTTWAEGFNHMRVALVRNNIRGANGAGVYVNTYAATPAVKWKALECVGNHVWDDQPTPTCTVAIQFINSDDIEQKTFYGNTKDANVATLISGLTSGSWRTNGDYPEEWAGYQDPNDFISAPPTSTYRRLNANAIYVKESPASFNTGWVALRGTPHIGIRDIGVVASGTGALDMTDKMPASVDGDIELLFIGTTVSPGPGSDATLSTPAGFVKKLSAMSNYSGNTINSRVAVWWRRKRPGLAVPVVADSGDFNEAVVVAYKDCIGYGDPFDFTPVASQNNGLTQAVSATGGTTVTDGAFYGVALAWFNGGATISVSGWANADADLTEQYEVLDRGIILGSDRIGLALFAGRVETAAAIDATTATINAESYAVWAAIAFALRPAQTPARATGTITCVAKASLADSDYITIGDGIAAPKQYEFDTAGDGVTGGRIQVNVSADTTAAHVAARLRTAILANQPSLSVVDNSDGTLSISHQWTGAGGNVAMSENVANAGFTVSGLAGGAG